MSTRKSSVIAIADSIDEFTSGLPELEKTQFNKVYALLKDLYLDSEGNIKNTLENLKIIGRVKTQLQSLVDSPLYQDKVSALSEALDNVNTVQTSYFNKTFRDFTKPKTVDKLQELAFDSTVDQLAGAGIQENVISMSADVVEQHIRDGSSFTTLVDELKVKMIGNKDVDSKLLSYTKQTINDTLSGFSRNYHALVTDDLGLEWYTYIGALVDTSRPFCIAMVDKKYIHKSEFASVLAENSKEGLMAGTNASNLVQHCGGWNCSHQLIPVPVSAVPTELRRKFEPEIKADSEEVANLRPKRR